MLGTGSGAAGGRAERKRLQPDVSEAPAGTQMNTY